MSRKNRKTVYQVKIKQGGQTRLLKINARSPEQASNAARKKLSSDGLILSIRKLRLRFS